jgi:hypothetical protein
MSEAKQVGLKITLALVGMLGAANLGCVAVAQIIDHQAIPAVASLPQATIDQIGRFRWYFIHASVGDNIMQGLRDLHSTNAIRYPLQVTTFLTNPAPPESTVPGMVYEHHFSSNKMSQFQAMVDRGWRSPTVDVAVMKFCYLEGLATAIPPATQLATQYVALMASLEQRHSNTIFVYVSMPLLIYREESDPRRDAYYLPSIVNINRFNDWLRAYCRTNHKLLYDLADMESHDPDGNETTFAWTNGQSYAAIYAPYVYNTNSPPGANSGHLITLGRQQVARGWYAVAAAMVSNLNSRPALGWSRETNRLCFSWSASGFTLQHNTKVADPAGWQDVLGAGQGSHLVTNDTTPAKFYRLRR